MFLIIGFCYGLLVVGKQLFKNKRGEIQLSVFDILNQEQQHQPKLL
jgi:hypothetical protein